MKARIAPSICGYCGCGCRLNYQIKNGQPVGTLPDPTDPVSQGLPCLKGLTSHRPLTANRLTTPQLRKTKNKPLRPCSWEEAYALIISRLKKIKPQEVMFTGSGEFTNEDNFVLSKFARTVIKTNNVDCCARLCHAATVWAMRRVFGTQAMPDFIDDLKTQDVIFVIGSNPAANYPVAFHRIEEALKKGAQLISVQIEANETSKKATLALNIPYFGITALIGGVIHLLVNSKLKIQNEKLEGFSEFRKSAGQFTPDYVAGFCQIPKEKLIKAAKIIKDARSLAVMFGMGVTQHFDGAENAETILNLALLKEAKVLPMRGKVSVQGAADMGACPDFKPFGGSGQLLKERWGIDENELIKGEMLTNLYHHPFKAFWIMGMNPAQSLPDLNRVHEIFKKAFVIYQHHHPSVTMQMADVVLPTTMMAEKEGTITNAERRVRFVNQAVKPPPQVKQSWQIFSEIAKMVENGFGSASPGEIFEEITQTIPEYAHLTWGKVKEDDHLFADKKIRWKKFVPLRHLHPPKTPPKDYPFVLTTARCRHHFCTGEGTRETPELLKLVPKALAHINPKDALRLHLAESDKVKIASKSGEICAEVKVDPEIRKGYVLVPFHFENILVNKLSSFWEIDKVSGTPNYKAIFVKIKKG